MVLAFPNLQAAHNVVLSHDDNMSGKWEVQTGVAFGSDNNQFFDFSNYKFIPKAEVTYHFSSHIYGGASVKVNTSQTFGWSVYGGYVYDTPIFAPYAEVYYTHAKGNAWDGGKEKGFQANLGLGYHVKNNILKSTLIYLSVDNSFTKNYGLEVGMKKEWHSRIETTFSTNYSPKSDNLTFQVLLGVILG